MYQLDNIVANRTKEKFQRIEVCDCTHEVEFIRKAEAAIYKNFAMTSFNQIPYKPF